jgi:hypothetical protein
MGAGLFELIALPSASAFPAAIHHATKQRRGALIDAAVEVIRESATPKSDLTVQ